MMPATWRGAAASVTGTSHLKDGTPCDDRHVFEVVDGPVAGRVLVGVVCDGAGSAKRAAEGAQLACNEALNAVRSFVEDDGDLEELEEAAVRSWVSEVRAALARHSVRGGYPLEDLRCTFLLAVVGTTRAVFVQVGDGAMVVADPEGGWCWVHWPQHGEYANTTTFLTDVDAPQRAAVDVSARAVDEIAMFSDGIERLVLQHATRTVHAAFFDRVFAPIRALEKPGLDDGLSDELIRFLDSPAVCERTDDDKTLLLASRHPQH